MRLGSLCTGYGGLDLAVDAVLGTETVWYSELDPNAAKVCERRFPGVPNLGDLTTLDWSQVPPVDVLTAGYPCFVAGTPVLTHDGYRPVESVKVGDLVLTHRGRWRVVTATMQKTDAPTVTVSAQGTHEVRCTPEHPWWTEEGEWVDAASLRGRRVVQLVPQRDDNAEELPLPLLWVLGRHLADGFCQTRKGRDSGRVTIVCNHSEADVLGARIKEAGLGGYRNVERTVTRFAITRTEFYKLALSCGTGAGHKRVPGWLLETLTREGAEALLDGYLTGDGSPDKRQGGWTATTISPALAYGMALVAQIARGVVCSVRLNRVPPTKVIEGRTVNQQPFYKLTVPASNRSGRVDGDRAIKLVRKVVPSEPATVYNIAVDEDESYVVANAVVHNCQPFSHAGKRQGTSDVRHLWPFIADAVRVLRPRYVVLENVAGHLSLGADLVLADLEETAYHAEWAVVRASDVGACHRRARLFIVAEDRYGRRVRSGDHRRGGLYFDSAQREAGAEHILLAGGCRDGSEGAAPAGSGTEGVRGDDKASPQGERSLAGGVGVVGLRPGRGRISGEDAPAPHAEAGERNLGDLIPRPDHGRTGGQAVEHSVDGANAAYGSGSLRAHVGAEPAWPESEHLNESDSDHGEGDVGTATGCPVLDRLSAAHLATIGFSARWSVVRASDVGACHRRARLFIVAADAERPERRTVSWFSGAEGQQLVPRGRVEGAAPLAGDLSSAPDASRSRTWRDPRAVPRQAPQGGRSGVNLRSAWDAGGGATDAADSSGGGLGPWPGLREGESGEEWRGRPGDAGGETPADTDDFGREGTVTGSRRDDRRGDPRPAPDPDRVGLPGCDDTGGVPGLGEPGSEPSRARPTVAWGDYEPAIRRHRSDAFLTPSAPLYDNLGHGHLCSPRLRPEGARSELVLHASQAVVGDREPSPEEVVRSTEAAGGGSLLGAGGEDADLLALDRSDSTEGRPRTIQRRTDGDGTPMGIRDIGGSDPEWIDDRSSVSGAALCEPGTYGASHLGGKSAPAGVSGDSLPVPPPVERSESLLGPEDGLSTLSRVSAQARLDTKGEGRRIDWGAYAPAIERHELAVGRLAPSPVNTEGALDPLFVEFMMMLPLGWVTDVLPRRSHALKALGNGVVPAQAEYAIRGLLARLDDGTLEGAA